MLRTPVVEVPSEAPSGEHPDAEPSSPRPTRAPGRPARTRARRLRRLAGLAVLITPTLWVVSTDLLRRGRLLFAFDRPHALGYLGSVVESLLFWGVLLHVAARRRGRFAQGIAALFLLLFTLAMGVEGAFHAFYNIYLSMDGQVHSKSIPWSIVGTLPFSRPIVLAHVVGALALGAALLVLARRFVRPRPWPRRITPLLVPLVLYAVIRVPVSYRTLQSTPFDMIYFHGVAAVTREHLGITHDSPDLRVQRRDPEDVPALTARPLRPRNVLFVLQESQRADVSCIDYEPDCKLATRFTNKLLPNRLPLRQLRSNASTTAISISNIWSGVRPTERRDTLHSVPLLWDYARAAGYDTAYWTSQNLMFGNARLYVQDIPVSHRCVATELDTQADLDTGAADGLVTDRVIQEWGELKEPFFAVVHYSNVHFPYVYDEEFAPFQPADMDKSAEKNEEFKNYYKNVVYLSDMAVGRMLSFIRDTDAGKRTVVVYTSDHGESFREHWQLGHTSSVYDEEIHVPGWVDAPPGTLAPEEEANLRAAADEMIWHLDFAPTFLDLLGLWDDPGLLPFRGRMMGHPLTRRERTTEPVPLTNCTWLWECAFRNWGMMQGPLKLEAREWDNEYHCFNVIDDPDEQHNLGEQACAPLPDLARSTFHVMPNITPPGRPQTDWGKK
jgi:glucan phosphoethanolaminetransferase (alkaline phosphatase superfamily)